MLEKKGAVAGATAYADNQKVAEEVAFSLPGINFATAEVKAMGNMSVPIIGVLENMEMTVTKVGIDMGFSRLSRLKTQNLEFRWAQNVIDKDGGIKVEGCKAFVRTLPGNIPEIGVEPGNPIEGELTYGVTRIQVFVDGKEIFLADRLSQILRVDGVDHMKAITSLL